MSPTAFKAYQMYGRRILFLIAALICPSGMADESVSGVDLQEFADRHCQRCHGEQTQKAERRFDRLTLPPKSADDVQLLQDMLDQLNLGQMPPSRERQPEDTDRQSVVAQLTALVSDWHDQHADMPNETVLRRLNSREYRNTVRDLLQINVEMFDPTADFPKDATLDHVDTVGDQLVVSGYLLKKYLLAAELCVDKAVLPLECPEVRTWRFTKGFRQQPEIDQVFRNTSRFEHMTLLEVIGADKHEGAYGPVHEFADGVPVDGIYEVRLKAEAVNRQHPYDPDFYGTDPGQPLRLGIVPGNRRVGQLHKPQPIEPLLADIELADEERWYTVRVPLDAGLTPRFTFRNGPMDLRSLYGRLVRKYPDRFPGVKGSGIVEVRRAAIADGHLPQIRIHEIEIKGPLNDSWPRPSQQAVWQGDWDAFVRGDISEAEIRTNLNRFLSRAFRRTVRQNEVEHSLQFIRSRKDAGRSTVESYTDALKAALCSPAFLYLDEPASGSGVSGKAADPMVAGSALASRLSYFLWSTMPDDELLQAGISGDLLQPDVLRHQTERLLADQRADSFVHDFCNSWLTLRDLGSSPPDRSAFPQYYHHDLGNAMRTETELFFRHLLNQDLSPRLFLDADFTFVNRNLARHYDLNVADEVFHADEFRKVNLDDRRRGGLLGQASVLTVTANGIDTSPVVRGVWLLENILGTPPSPPPPDVPPLDPDVRGAKGIREQLEKHRTVATCNECHRKIDPPGFALEHFDPIGHWRNTYAKKVPIDASGELPDGRRFSNVGEFRALLLDQYDQFLNALTRRLLMYGTGRPLTVHDRPEVDRIVQECSSGDHGFRQLILSVVASNAFRSR
ncbi:MAG: DUF1592 domain-containing protein [Planctomycetaceae bacterium]